MTASRASYGPVLLVGGCGFLGHHIILDLLSTTDTPPANIFIYDINVARTRPFYTSAVPPENYHEGDMGDATRLRTVLDSVQPRLIFDLVSPQAFDLPADLYMGVNVEARRILLTEVKKTKDVRALVFNSTAGVVHDSRSDLVDADETLPILFSPQQREIYSHSKAVAETLALDANGVSSSEDRSGTVKTPLLLTAAVRICSPFGANHGEVIKPIVENAAAGKYRFQMGDGRNLSDWTCVENGARAHVLVAEKLLSTAGHRLSPPEGTVTSDSLLLSSHHVDGEAFFITNDQHIPFWSFLRTVGAAAGYPTDENAVKVIPRGVGMFMAFVSEWVTWAVSLGRRKAAFTRAGVRYSTITRTYKIDKAKERFGYEPVVGLEEGIRRAVAPYLGRKKD